MTIKVFPSGCPVCETKTETKHHCTMEGHNYVKCLNCNLIYQTGQTNIEKITARYTGGALKSLRRNLLNRFRKIENQRDFELRMTRANQIFDYASSKAPEKSKRYLDIGCNKGFNVYASEEKGWQGHGIELIDEILVPIKNSKPHLKERLKIGSFIEVSKQYEDESFDLITCIDVIEHLLDPKYALSEVFRILKPGGVAIFQTPEATEENIELKENWQALKPNEHLLLFNQANFETIAKKANFNKIEFSEQPFEMADGNFVVNCYKN